MPNNKRHSAKKIKATGNSKSSGSKLGIHPASRKATQLQRVALRQSKLERAKFERQRLITQRVDKINYFKYAMDPSRDQLSLNELHDLIHEFLKRNDEEITIQESNRRPGRPPSTKLDSLLDNKSIEYNLYKSGFEVPDLTDPENVKLLRQWEGDDSSLWRIKMIRLIDPDTSIGKSQQDKMEL